MASDSDVGTLEQLTPREREVQQLLRLGLTDAEIAQRLGISAAGASYHVSEIIGKLGVRNRYEAGAWPERPPWWATAMAPVALFWRKAGAALAVRPATLAAALAGGLFGAALVGLGLIAFLLLRDDGDPGLALAPAATLTPPAALSPPQRVVAATPTPAPLPTLAPTSGTLVYLRGSDLWVASLDSEQGLPPWQITSDSQRVSYAGYVRRPDGRFDLYYLSQLTETVGLYDEVEIGLYRVGPERDQAQEVFRFMTELAHLAGADVAPDGERVVYTDMDGLVLRDLASGEIRELAQIRRILAPDGSLISTDILTDPQWSPAGDVIHATKFIGPDSIVNVLINPFSSLVVTDTGYEGYVAAWAPDGHRLCLWSSYGQGGGGVVISDLATSETTDVLAADRLPAQGPYPMPSVHGCAWSEDGRLAVSYTPNLEEPGRIFVLDEDLNVVAESESDAAHLFVAAWLPDGSGVIFNRFDQQGNALGPAIFQPESGITEPSFEADWVLGVIP